MTTIAQKIEKRGIEKGIEEEKILTAKRMLSEEKNLKGAELIAWVHRMTGLSIERLKKLNNKH